MSAAGSVNSSNVTEENPTPMALGSKHLQYEKRDGVAWLTLDRPEKKNAYTKEMYLGIARACVEGDEDPEVQLTVITANGNAFSVGGDLGKNFFEDSIERELDFHALDPIGEGPDALLPLDPFLTIQRSKKLVIAVVNGFCQAGGMITAMLADLTIASDRATFRIPELLRGVADPWFATRLPMYVGMERAKWLMFTARVIDAQQALAWGLVSDVVPHEELGKRTEELLDEVLLTGPEARAFYKAAANRFLLDPDYDAYRTSQQSDECREGLAAFVEKRAPHWVPPGRREALGRL